MLAKRVIPCLDVRDGVVVKGVRFRDHQVLGEVLELAIAYCQQGADELVFYDISASAEGRLVSRDWVQKTARVLDIPFCVAGGIRSIEDAETVLNLGADKISINSPALERPSLIDDLAKRFGSQCVVIGVDSQAGPNGHFVYQYTGRWEKTVCSSRRTLEWLGEVQDRGAGEVVLNCMGADGVGTGYDLAHLIEARRMLKVPLVASGGAGALQHFVEVFDTGVDGALAAGVFHRKQLTVGDVKMALRTAGIEVRS